MRNMSIGLISLIVFACVGCAPNNGPKWMGTAGVIRTSQATVLVDGEATTVRVVCTRGCE